MIEEEVVLLKPQGLSFGALGLHRYGSKPTTLSWQGLMHKGGLNIPDCGVPVGMRASTLHGHHPYTIVLVLLQCSLGV